MRRLITLFFLIFVLSGVVMAQQMSDDQVIQYVKEANKSGKSQKQITTELLRRGVTKEQVSRIQQKYSESNTVSNKSNEMPSQLRQRTLVDDGGGQRRTTDYSEVGMLDETVGGRVDNRADNTATTDNASQIFGHDVFTNRNLTFEPSINLATPVDYRLGPGDEVIIDVWGASENTIRQSISPEGTIQVSGLGPVQLSGMTVKDANAYLQREFSKIYSGISGSEPTSQIKLTLGDIRTIQINIMGEVAVPGTYTLSSFSSVFHALYRAGGVNKIGSLRSIKVVRNGKTIADLDVYDYLMKGKMKDDIRLQEGDVIIVNPYESLVRIAGKVKRPMFYEMKPTETVATILNYAGGFTGDAYKKAVRIIRKSGREHQVYNVDEMDYSVFRLDDGDSISVDAVLKRFENRVEIRGAVYRSGLYELSGTVNTVKQLIKKAEGLRGDAFLNRALLDRENEDLSHEVIAVDLGGLLKGTVADIPLQKNDILYIPSIHDLKEEETISIHGEVANPGTFLFSKNMTIEDLLVQSGGLLEAAATTKVDITRRIKDPKSTSFSSVLGKTYSFDIKDGLVVGGEGDFHLEPFDEVYVRKSPAYRKQQNVVVAGEVLFGGNYALVKKNERLSDLISKAGGITPDAYVKGARLIRKMTEEEQRRQADAVRMARMGEGKDSISVEKLNISDTYTVGINLEKAISNPGSDFDLVLREGDVLFIPEYINTVKISGAVMYPNTVLYKRGESLRYYINQAGGYGNLAKKKKAYVVYMNGTVSRLKSRDKKAIEPGCEIIVPSKEEKKRMSTAEILGMGSTTASIAAMIATMVNLFK
ncbi:MULTISPECIES: SLBB domain-containing protein [Bacteroides]|jgi:protein involved in polysaccharide export with SLBB domain|uniref:Capsule biosynthesis protein n=2 Tax=Bacteroides intestinalis TaxID=329854 RepID=A0AAQ0LQG0_9BACE|nr:MULTISPECIES: SLBB domain-containing protein [Bacteroides]QDO70867.1 capsule biosynthesis protein [Bacteroides intestinalis]RGT54745.1 capsule biosynthesis protein [Bacteroides intestinalis]RGX85367.1 capsule biosynthesis protein [Bacteroides intestinalis]RHE82818.1 capsule biosynthesis protein [Bacteroides intestinalis]RHN05639.1 capsule biosynthesis protein [Bacteroides intestinalis]